MLEPKTRLAGRYEIVRLIGEGGMGEVYEARHVEIGKRVAIKVLNPDHVNDTETLSRFHQEARIAGNLGHVNICEVLDYGSSEEGRPYIVMEYLEGENLKDMIHREGKLDSARALAILDQVLFALQEAHGRGIIHRDLKPENIFLAMKKGQGVVVKLLDFGISKVAVDGEKIMRLTRTGTMVGTPYYMSPEQVRQLDDVDQRADLYACGVILYEMLVGKVPFSGRSFNEVIVHILEDDFDLPPDGDAASPWVKDLLSFMLDKDRERRASSATELREMIAGYLGDPDRPPAVATAHRADLVRSRWRRTTMFVLSPIIALLAVFAIVMVIVTVLEGDDGRGHDGLFPVPVNGKWGFVDIEGDMVISPIYDGAGDFSEGLARVGVGAKWGFVDREGNLVAEPVYEEAGDFSEGLAAVRVGQRWGTINRFGKQVASPLFEQAGDFHEGFAAVLSGERWGYVDTSGKVVIDPSFLQVDDFSEGLAAVEIEGQGQTAWGYVGPTGDLLIKPSYSAAGRFKSGRARVKICGEDDVELCPWSFIDTSGKPLFDKRFDWAGDFADGMALAMKGGRWGYIDLDGHWAIDPRFAHAGDFSEGLARVASGGRWGFIDTSGRFVVTPNFYAAGDFSGGAAPVTFITRFEPGASAPLTRQTGYIDRRGSFFWNGPEAEPVKEPPGYDRSLFNFDFLTGEIRVIGSFDPTTYELKFREEKGTFTTVPLDLPHPLELGRIKGVIPGENYTIVVADHYVAITLGWAAMIGGETTLLAMRVQGTEIVRNVNLLELTEDARGDNLLAWELGNDSLYLLTRGGKLKHRVLSDFTAAFGEHILHHGAEPPAAMAFADGLLFVFGQGDSYTVVDLDVAGRFEEHVLGLGLVATQAPTITRSADGLVLVFEDRQIRIDLADVRESLAPPAPPTP